MNSHAISYLPAYMYQSTSNPISKKDSIRERSLITDKGMIQSGSIKSDNKKLKDTISKSQLLYQQPIPSQTINSIHQTLLSILHDKIATQQIYPESAIVLNQTGKVSIYFILNTNGDITNITLQKSSGVTCIDLAALDAVKRSSPINETVNYLKQPESFVIDVIFQ
jgi:TonB family protein